MEVDFVTVIHELMARDLSVGAFMLELVAAHERAYPERDWEPVKRIELDEVDTLLQRWLAPCFKREPPRGKHVKAFFLGLFNPIRNDEPITDMYIAGSKSFELHEVPCAWRVAPAYLPMLRYANSRVLPQIHRAASDVENYLALGYAAKTFATLLPRVDAALVLGARKEVQVTAGWDSGDVLYFGKLTREGFVLTPLADALANLAEARARVVRYHEKLALERTATLRHFRHPDGRRWSIGVAKDWIELRFTDVDGDEHTRKRGRVRDEDLAAVARALVDEQIAGGFVEAQAV